MSYSVAGLGFDRQEGTAGAFSFTILAVRNLQSGQSILVIPRIKSYMRNAGFLQPDGHWVEGGRLAVTYRVPEGSAWQRDHVARRTALQAALNHAADSIGPNVAIEVRRSADDPQDPESPDPEGFDFEALETPVRWGIIGGAVGVAALFGAFLWMGAKGRRRAVTASRRRRRRR